MRDYRFHSEISRPVLQNYLSRAISMSGLSESEQRDEDLRMLENVGAKFVGRAAHFWATHSGEDFHFNAAREMTTQYRERDPDTIFQACIFEVVSEPVVSTIPIPAWVFEEFGRPVEHRAFNYEAMLYDPAAAMHEPVKWQPHAGNNWMRDYFGRGNSVPDMSKLETQLWFFYRAKRYIDAGCEALHLGQVHLMNNNDPTHAHWWDVLKRIRKYGAATARRGKVLIDAHTHGIALADGTLLFDFHSYPQHIKDDLSHYGHVTLEKGFRHSILGKSLGGKTVNGWSCEHLPFIVEFDNWGSSGQPGAHLDRPNWVWGCDEISWFARQPAKYRNEYLRYATNRVQELDPNGFLQVPGKRQLVDPLGPLTEYRANTKSPASPTGFSQEETIRELWT